jgi:integrase
MATKKLNTVNIKDTTPGQTIWDSELKGFGCRARQTAKVFVLKYRFGKGRGARQYMYTIGRFGSPWTAESARVEARRLLGRIALGENPAHDRIEQSGIPTMADAFGAFLASADGKRSTRTLEEYRRMFSKNCSHLRLIRVSDIQDDDILRLHRNLKDTPTLANRIVQMLSAFFNWCGRRGWRKEYLNPCRHVEKYPERQIERIPTSRELLCLGEAIKQYESDYRLIKVMSHKRDKSGAQEVNSVTSYVTTAIRLLLFTGARKSEITTLQWCDVDLEKRQIRLLKSKTGKKTIYLSNLATQLLSELPRIEGNPFVIPGAKAGTHLVNIKDLWKRIRQIATISLWCDDPTLAKLVAEQRTKLPLDVRTEKLFSLIQETARQQNIDLPTGLMDFRLHDVRHNFASLGVLGNHHLKVVGALLGHKSVKTTERYAHLANDPVHTASDLISESLAKAMA